MSGCQIMSPRLKNPRDVLLSTTFCKLHLTLYWISTDCRKALCSSGQNPSLGQTNHYSQPRKIHTCPLFTLYLLNIPVTYFNGTGIKKNIWKHFAAESQLKRQMDKNDKSICL